MPSITPGPAWASSQSSSGPSVAWSYGRPSARTCPPLATTAPATATTFTNTVAPPVRILSVPPMTSADTSDSPDRGHSSAEMPATSQAPRRSSRPKRARQHPGQGKKTREAPVEEVGCGDHTSYPEPHPSRRKPGQQSPQPGTITQCNYKKSQPSTVSLESRWHWGRARRAGPSVVRSAQRGEELPDVADQQVRLLHRGEVAPPVVLRPANDAGECRVGQRPHGQEHVRRKD